MNKDIVFIKTNSLWKDEHSPLVTVITSNYNRREILLRCMKSVNAQTFRDIEYIVVDNGSYVAFDDIMEQFMAEAGIPVMFIKRSNGIGRQTGRNSAIRRARGKYLTMVDSDDEFLPDGIEKLVRAWESIPEDKWEEYREVVDLCQNEHGKLIGIPFPDGMNELSKKEMVKMCHQPGLGSEHAALERTDIMKANLFPEPEGVSNYLDSILWWKLSKQYRSFFLNEISKVYYAESSDSITNAAHDGLVLDDCIGRMWSHLYYLNNIDDYNFTFVRTVRECMYYLMFKNVLKSKGKYPEFQWAKDGITNKKSKILSIILWIPAKLITPLFVKHHNGINF